MVLTLDRAITVDGRQVRELKLRRVPKLRRALKRLRTADSDYSRSIIAITTMVHLTSDQVRALELADFRTVSEALGDRLKSFSDDLEALMKQKGLTHG